MRLRHSLKAKIKRHFKNMRNKNESWKGKECETTFHFENVLFSFLTFEVHYSKTFLKEPWISFSRCAFSFLSYV